jgi:hypothetical protein
MTLALGSVISPAYSGSNRVFTLPDMTGVTGLVVILGSDSTATYAAPAGWGEQVTYGGSNTTSKVSIWTRGVTGTEGATVTFVAPGAVGYMIPVTGGDPVNVVDRATAGMAFNTATATLAALTTRLPGEIVITANEHYVSGSSGTGGPALSSGTGSEIATGTTGNYALAVRALPVASAGSTGALTNTWTAASPTSAIAAITLRPAGGNIAPSIDVGVDRLITYGDTFQAVTTASDPEGPITYAWTVATKPAGAVATFSSSSVANPTLRPDKPGTWVLTCVVTDSGGVTAADSITLTVQAQMWTRVAGAKKAARLRTRQNGVVS